VFHNKGKDHSEAGTLPIFQQSAMWEVEGAIFLRAILGGEEGVDGEKKDGVGTKKIFITLHAIVKVKGEMRKSPEEEQIWG